MYRYIHIHVYIYALPKKAQSSGSCQVCVDFHFPLDSLESLQSMHLVPPSVKGGWRAYVPLPYCHFQGFPLKNLADPPLTLPYPWTTTSGRQSGRFCLFILCWILYFCWQHSEFLHSAHVRSKPLSSRAAVFLGQFCNGETITLANTSVYRDEDDGWRMLAAPVSGL